MLEHAVINNCNIPFVFAAEHVIVQHAIRDMELECDEPQAVLAYSGGSEMYVKTCNIFVATGTDLGTDIYYEVCMV